MSELRKGCEAERAVLEQERQSFMPHWRDLSDFIDPRRGRFVTTDHNRGDKRNTKIINSTALYAKRVLQAGMSNGITSQSRPWFRLVTPDPDLMEYAPVRNWLYTVEARMRQMFSRSNLYTVMPTFYGELGTFGTATMCMLEDDQSLVRFYPYTIGSYSLAQNERLIVDTIYRDKVKLTVRQMVNLFGLNSCSGQVQDMWKRGDYQKTVDVIHAIKPRVDRDPRKMDNRNMPFQSVWYELAGAGASGELGVLRESGFEEFPVLAARWETTAEDTYGTSCPGMITLGDNKQLQHEERRKAQAIDKHVDPPMRADPSLRNQYSSIVAGGITYVESGQGRDGFSPALQTHPQAIMALKDSIGIIEDRMNRGWFVDLFLQLANDTRSNTTAHEIALRHEEKLLMLGPVVERTNTEVLDRLIDRGFNIMMRRGQLPEPPDELDGVDLRVDYISILAQAQKMVALGAIERFVQFSGAVGQLNPASLKKVNFDQSIDHYADSLGVPPDLVVPDDVVAAQNEQEAQQKQAMQAAAMAQAGAQAAGSLGKIPMGEDTALSRLAEIMTGQPL